MKRLNGEKNRARLDGAASFAIRQPRESVPPLWSTSGKIRGGAPMGALDYPFQFTSRAGRRSPPFYPAKVPETLVLLADRKSPIIAARPGSTGECQNKIRGAQPDRD
jgi:hypothetical protein